MSAVVPYAAYPPMVDPRFVAAGRAARYIYDHPQTARKMARGIKRAWNKYKARVPKFKQARSQRTREISKVGEDPGTGTSKRFVPEDADAMDHSSRVLFSDNLTDIPQSATNNDIDGRQRQIAFVSGFHICMELWNNSTTLPLYVNVAIVVPKATTTVTSTNFFRGSGNDRSLDFSTALSANDFHCLPICTDKYIILKHIRICLDPQSATFSGKQYRNLDFYVPFKRQIRWRDNVSSLADNGNVYLCYWCDLFQTAAGSALTANVLKLSKRCVTYFREPKGC